MREKQIDKLPKQSPASGFVDNSHSYTNVVFNWEQFCMRTGSVHGVTHWVVST